MRQGQQVHFTHVGHLNVNIHNDILQEKLLVGKGICGVHILLPLDDQTL